MQFLRQLLSQSELPDFDVYTHFGALWAKQSTRALCYYSMSCSVFFSFVSRYVFLYVVAYSYCFNLPIGLLQYWFLWKRKFGVSCLTWWRRLLGSEPSCDLFGFKAQMLKLDINQWFPKPNSILFILTFFWKTMVIELTWCVCICLSQDINHYHFR